MRLQCIYIFFGPDLTQQSHSVFCAQYLVMNHNSLLRYSLEIWIAWSGSQVEHEAHVHENERAAVRTMSPRREVQEAVVQSDLLPLGPHRATQVPHARLEHQVRHQRLRLRGQFHVLTLRSVSRPDFEVSFTSRLRGQFHVPNFEVNFTSRLRGQFHVPTSRSVSRPDFEVSFTSRLRGQFHVPTSRSVSRPDFEVSFTSRTSRSVSRPDFEVSLTSRLRGQFHVALHWMMSMFLRTNNLWWKNYVELSRSIQSGDEHIYEDVHLVFLHPSLCLSLPFRGWSPVVKVLVSAPMSVPEFYLCWCVFCCVSVDWNLRINPSLPNIYHASVVLS